MNGRNIIYSGTISTAAIVLSFPYIYYIVLSEAPNVLIEGSFFIRLLAEIGKLFLVVFLSCMAGFTWSEKLGYGGLGTVLDLQRNWKRILVYGAFIGLAVYIFGDRYFIKVAPQFYPSQIKYVLFIPFYAALVEEIFARFGVMTIITRAFGSKHLANIMAALIFAIGHMNLFRIGGIIYRLNYLTISSLIINVCISLFFGYIYWRKGLAVAMGVHFIANLRYLFIALML